ncbi:toxin RelE [Acidihalobacter prosperus]|uniref:Toxin RelE n=2 Tax=Acidihalobacter prosperus TaxID=160660 RepID=A0A1A6C1G4_9GAMM|nr:toxin RelE [Acidihalobacter prosperus]
MRQLNGVYTQATNRRHHKCGHLFQGRFKGILVDKDHYLLELARYVVLNPVRAGMIKHPIDYPWSSYPAMMGEATPPDWLATQGLLALFASRRSVARRRYAQFVAEGIGQQSVWTALRQQIYLGDEAFVRWAQKKAAKPNDRFAIPRVQRRAPPKSLAAIETRHAERNDAIVEAYATGAYSYREIAEHFGLHLATVGRIVRSAMLQGVT